MGYHEVGGANALLIFIVTIRLPITSTFAIIMDARLRFRALGPQFSRDAVRETASVVKSIPGETMFRRIFTLSIAITLTATLTVTPRTRRSKPRKTSSMARRRRRSRTRRRHPAEQGVPAVVCVHGGGWKAGSRQSLGQLTEILAKHNFVAVTVTYRFAPKHSSRTDRRLQGIGSLAPRNAEVQHQP